ncbi:hypothetical protein [Streptomyces sp. KL116D]|uniref:hypothetical protein n=1 Tax=Streptomyces sp. KL116D TaxID=3045152 RepID=UPI003556C61D
MGTRRATDQRSLEKQDLAEESAASEAIAVQLRRLLEVAAPASRGGGCTREANALRLSLKGIWERGDPGLDAYKETEDAVAFLDGFFAPLLSPDAFTTALTGDRFLRRYPGGTALTSQEPGDPMYVDYALRAFTPTFLELDEALAEALPAPLDARLANFVAGVVVLCSVPVRIAYHHFHGTAAYTVIAERHIRVLVGARASARAAHAEMVLSGAAGGRTLSSDEEYVLVTTLDAVQSMVTTRLDSVTRFQQDKADLPPRIRVPAAELTQRVAAIQFWVHGPPDNRRARLGKPSTTGPEDKPLPYYGTVLDAGGERVHARSFYALPESWRAFENFCRLVCQAGFSVYVNACSNAHGGRHPKHVTHREGVEFDVDWTFTSSPGDTVRNLARRRKKYGTGIFRDVERDRYFSLEPVPGDPQLHSHRNIEALSTLVVFQAAALSGLHRYLYSDVENMILAAEYLGWVVDQSLFAQVGRKANIPVAEGVNHADHLHGEVTSPVTRCLDETVLTTILHQALVRDAHKEFSSTYLLPPWQAPSSAPKTDAGAQKPTPREMRTTAFIHLWAERAAAGLPALLPVWLPTEDLQRRWLPE